MTSPNDAVPPSVVLRLPAVLRELVDGSREVPVTPVGTDGAPATAGATLVDVLQAVSQRWPVLARRLRDETGALRRYVNVYVDGEDVRGLQGLQTPVPAGSLVEVLPSIAGG